MPEGDMIYRAARTLNQALAGRVVTGFETALAEIARVNDDTPLVGRTVERVESRGKWCLMHFAGRPDGAEPLILVTHMRMSGSWHLYRPGERWKMPRSAMRVVVRVGAELGGVEAGPSISLRSAQDDNLHGYEAVAFNMPVIEFHTPRTLERTEIPTLGPDVLGAEFTADSGSARLQAYAREHPEAEVGVVLLNQRVLSGL